ncbi:hypothetical protein CE91St61_07750 [Lachnospiraceae bacterium]|nr:hypothetical protein CE91St61_07750 [Lachnospiraceae bacterium]
MGNWFKRQCPDIYIDSGGIVCLCSGVGNQADTKSPHRRKGAAELYGCRT